MWINTTERMPEKDGYYLVVMNYGEVYALRYTVEGGWNTYRDSDGALCSRHAIKNVLVSYWLDAPMPPEVNYEV